SAHATGRPTPQSPGSMLMRKTVRPRQRPRWPPRARRTRAKTCACSTSRRSPALEGVRALALTPGLAGPTATRTLAEFGADVVKINNPSEEGAGYRWQVHRYHTDVNRGKRTILLDLKRPEGREVCRQLIRAADVLVQNFRPGVAERLGVGYEQARAERAEIIYASVGFLGSGGPWA